MPTLSFRAKDFVDHCDKINTVLREVFYSIEDQPVKGHWGEHGELYQLDDKERELLRGAANALYWRSGGLLADERRDRIRLIVSDAVELILSWQGNYLPVLPDEKAYRHQETVQKASTMLMEAQQDLIMEQQKLEDSNLDEHQVAQTEVKPTAEKEERDAPAAAPQDEQQAQTDHRRGPPQEPPRSTGGTTDAMDPPAALQEGDQEQLKINKELLTEGVGDEARVLAVFADNPDLNKSEIARKAGVNRTKVYRMPKFLKAYEFHHDAQIQSRLEAKPHGEIDPETGVIEVSEK